MTFVTAGLAIAGLAGILIPIAIHLIWRARRKPIEWAAMRFLLEAWRRQRRRLQVEQLLLLLVRCLIVALLGFALARPLIQDLPLPGSGQGRIVWLVIDDGLPSALKGDDGRTALARHIEAAGSIIDGLALNDRVGVVRASQPAELVVDPPSANRNGVRAVLERLLPVDAPSDIPGALEQIRPHLESASKERQESVVWLLSELRAGSARLMESAGSTAAIDPALVHLVALAPAAAPATNVSVQEVRAGRAVVGLDELASIDGVTVELARFGNELPAATSTIRISGPSFAPRSFEVQWHRGQTSSVTTLSGWLDLSAAPEGDLVITASVDADALEADDQSWSSVVIRRALRVGLVERADFGGAALDELSSGAWIRRALAPTDAGSLAIIEIEPTGLEESDLHTLDVLMVARPDLLGEMGWRAVHAMLERSGTVIVMPPPDLTVHQWTDALLEGTDLQWQIEREVETAAEPWRLDDDRSDETGWFEVFGRAEHADMVRPVAVSRRLRLSGVDRADAAFSFADGMPAIATTVRGGILVFMTVPPHLDWTNLPVKPLMVPLFQELVRAGVAWSRQVEEARTGDRPRFARAPGAAMVETPRGERLALDADGRPHAALRHAGVHRMLDHAGGAVGTQVVRIPSDAGRVEAQPEEAVGAWLARTGPWKFVQPGAIASALMRPPAEAGISTPLLMALLGLALLECFLARRFSHAAIERGGAAGGGGILTTLEERAARGRRSSSSESVA